MKRPLREALNVALIVLGILSEGMGLKGFLLSSHFIDGGVTGISMLVAEVFHLPLPALILVINLPFIALGYRQIGRAFAIRSTAAIFGLSFDLAAIPYPDVTEDLLLTAVFPLMSRDRFGRAPVTAHIVDRVLRIAVIGGVWMSLATVLGAPFIIRLIAGSPGHGAIAVLRIQALVFIPSFISTSCSLALISLRHYRQVTLVCAVALLLNVALGLVLVSALGAKGGALADVLTELAVATALTATLIRMLPGHRIPVSIVPPVVLALGLSATMLLLPIGSFARAIAGSLIYFGVLWLTRAIPPEVAEAAQRVRAAVP